MRACVRVSVCVSILLRKLSRQFTRLVAKTYCIAFGVCISPLGKLNGFLRVYHAAFASAISYCAYLKNRIQGLHKLYENQI